MTTTMRVDPLIPLLGTGFGCALGGLLLYAHYPLAGQLASSLGVALILTALILGFHERFRHSQRANRCTAELFPRPDLPARLRGLWPTGRCQHDAGHRGDHYLFISGPKPVRRSWA